MAFIWVLGVELSLHAFKEGALWDTISSTPKLNVNNTRLDAVTVGALLLILMASIESNPQMFWLPPPMALQEKRQTCRNFGGVQFGGSQCGSKREFSESKETKACLKIPPGESHQHLLTARLSYISLSMESWFLQWKDNLIHHWLGCLVLC